jgi:2-deoxy-D-gluconate 3-dehydrogenase
VSANLVNPFDLSGKVAVVTGGNGGIGLGMARGLAGAGASVVLLGRNAEKSAAAAEDLAAETGVVCYAVTADVSVEADVTRAVSEILAKSGAINILINNAGINIRKGPHEATLEEWQTVLDVNLTSAFLMSKAVYPSLKSAGGGKVINIGSMTSVFGASFAPAYAASKGAIVQLTKSQALAWAADNIQVNAILPGWIDTDLTIRARSEITGLHDRVLNRIPAGRWGKPVDLAGAAVWLSSAASDYVTGISVPIDGGYTSM